MKHWYKVFLYLILILPACGNTFVNGQQSIIRGKVIDSVTSKAVEYAYVIDYTQHVNLYSNINGEFNLHVQLGDTLIFYALGYEYHKIIVTDSLINKQDLVVFGIKPQTYEITEARIFPIGTYSEFRQQFINLDKPKSKTDILAETLAEISHKEARESYEKAKANQRLDGITLMSVPIRTPEEKERIKLNEILKQEKIRDQIYQKFNPEVIKKVTGMNNDKDIIEFMVFCDFPNGYLLEVSEYDLMTKIALKYELFKQKKQAEKARKNSINLNNSFLYQYA
jgi:hypothetical protein